MKHHVWHGLWLLLVGRRLSEAVDRNTRAADELDAVVKEILKR